MSATPAYCGTPVVGAVVLTTADTSRTAPVNSQPIFDPGLTGGLCQRVTIAPLATIASATVVRLFYKNTAGTFRLITEIQVAAVTLSATQANAPITLEAVNYPQLMPIVVPAATGTAWSIVATVNDAVTGLSVIGQGGGI